MRFAITREAEGERDVPVAMRVSGGLRGTAAGSSTLMPLAVAAASKSSGEGAVRLKKSAGTEPQVSGAMNEATALRPGWRCRSNLWTSLGVLPAWENNGLMTKRRGPHTMISPSLDLIGASTSDFRVIEKCAAVRLCSCRSKEKRVSGCSGL